MRFLLDTDAAIALIKGKPQAVEWLRRRAPAEVVISSVSKAELYYGARKSERVEHNLGVLHSFFGPLRSLTFDDRAAEECGVVRADLERAGTPIGPNDLLISALARSRDLTLVSLNRREFSRVAGLRLTSFEGSV
ncbi:MAG: type II toxin-antitoxin system VapC family toxin [Rubrobacteraceae bacterium]